MLDESEEINQTYRSLGRSHIMNRHVLGQFLAALDALEFIVTAVNISDTDFELQVPVLPAY